MLYWLWGSWKRRWQACSLTSWELFWRLTGLVPKRPPGECDFAADGGHVQQLRSNPWDPVDLQQSSVVHICSDCSDQTGWFFVYGCSRTDWRRFWIPWQGWPAGSQGGANVEKTSVQCLLLLNQCSPFAARHVFIAAIFLLFLGTSPAKEN